MPYQDNDFVISPELQYLLDEKIYVPTRPDDIMHSKLYDEFVDEVKIKINEYKPHLYKTRIYNSVLKSKVVSPFDQLHNSKIANDILPLIQEKSNLLYSENGQWLYIEEELSNLYMSILAKYLAVVNHDDTVIGTENKINENCI